MLLCIAGGIFAINVLFYFFLLKPVGADRDQQQRMYGEIRKIIAGGETLEQKYLRAIKDIETFKVRLLKQEEHTKLIEEVSTFSEHGKLILKNAGYSQKYLKEAELWTYIMELPLVGQYKDVKDFFAEIEGSPSVLCVDWLKIVRTKDGPLKLSLKVTSYLQ